MRKTTITISFDEEKLTAMRLYMSQKDLKLEGELDRVMEELYTNFVPANVQEFIDMRGSRPKNTRGKKAKEEEMLPAEPAEENAI